MSEDDKNKIRMERRLGNVDKALKLLRSYRMQNYDKLYRIEDKAFIDVSIASIYNQMGDDYKDLSNYYNECVKKINGIETDGFNYSICMWLDVNLNHKAMSKEEIKRKMKKCYDYYMSVNEPSSAYSSLETAAFLTKDREGVLKCLGKIISLEHPSSYHIDSILKDCERLGQDLYIEALSILNENGKGNNCS